MNNGPYLALMNLGRRDVMVSSGLWRAALRALRPERALRETGEART